jgi:hypothetical protein
MNFKVFYNINLREELSKEDRIKALKSMPTGRNFTVELFGGRGVKKFKIAGENLFNALKQLPENIFKDIFYNVDDFSNFEESDEEVYEFLNVCYGDGGLNVNVYEDGILICGCDSPDAYTPGEEYDDEEGGEE